MKKIFILVGGLIFLLVVGLWQGIAQSKKPTGFIGRRMIKMWNKTYSRLFTWVLSRITIHDDDIVLDIGIGGGISTIELVKNLSTGKVYGIDYSKDAVDDAIISNKKNIDLGKTIISIGDVTNLSFESDYFTLVTGFQTHFHWKDFEKALSEIYRVLKSNGRLVLACEISKVDYYMKDFLDSGYAIKFFEKNNFTNINIARSEGWIMFTMEK